MIRCNIFLHFLTSVFSAAVCRTDHQPWLLTELHHLQSPSRSTLYNRPCSASRPITVLYLGSMAENLCMVSPPVFHGKSKQNL